MYVYIESEPKLFTVGFYDPNGNWHSDSDHQDREKAAERVAWLNRGDFDKCYEELQGERKRADRLETAIKYATDYLDKPLNQIGYGSKAHRELLDAINEK